MVNAVVAAGHQVHRVNYCHSCLIPDVDSFPVQVLQKLKRLQLPLRLGFISPHHSPLEIRDESCFPFEISSVVAVQRAS